MVENFDILQFIQSTKEQFAAEDDYTDANQADDVVPGKCAVANDEFVPVRSGAADNSGSRANTAAADKDILNLEVAQIISEIYILSPIQLEMVIDYVARSIAIGMDIKAIYPQVKRIVDKSLKDVLAKSKRMGKK